jgi:hypothetical protein
MPSNFTVVCSALEWELPNSEKSISHHWLNISSFSVKKLVKMTAFPAIETIAGIAPTFPHKVRLIVALVAGGFRGARP